MRKLRHQLSYANVMSSIAVFVVLGGGAYAAATLPKNSVGSKQIKANAVTSSKVKNGSLLSSDFKPGQLRAGAVGPAGPAGPTGAAGPAGAAGVKGDKGDAGSALGFARVVAVGTLDATRSKNVTVNNHPTTGVYCLNVPASALSIIAQIDLSNAAPGDAEVHSSLIPSVLATYCAAGGNAVVLLYNTNTPALVDKDFNVLIN
jgi:hypothetical protein